MAAYLRGGKHTVAAELGSGTGIISLLCLQKEKAAHIYAIEIQPTFAELTRRNAQINRLETRIDCICADVREAVLPRQVDTVFSNPPYWRIGAGLRNKSDAKYSARHEVYGGIHDFCTAAARMLRHGGSFYTVFLPERMSELLVSLTAVGLEPKRLTPIAPDVRSRPSLILTEAVRGASPGMTLTPTLFLYNEKREETDEIREIYTNCAFPSAFLPQNRKKSSQEDSHGAK